jgi:hypothetical protein
MCVSSGIDDDLTARHLRLIVRCMRDQLLEFVVSGLKRRKGQWPAIAEATEISTKTMSRMLNGENNNRRDTLIALAEHFKANPIRPTRAASARTR